MPVEESAADAGEESGGDYFLCTHDHDLQTSSTSPDGPLACHSVQGRPRRSQAVVSDLQHGWRAFPNALAGVFLILAMPCQALDVDRLSKLAASGLFIQPVSYTWSALYTTWNCAFSYCGNFSWSTRVIMVAPWLISWHFNEAGVWIGARCICLCLNMILRATETTAFGLCMRGF